LLRRKYNNIYDDNTDEEDIKNLYLIDFINSNYTCNKEITNCTSIFNANVVPVNLNYIEHNLHIEGINDICKYH
jgi:acetolactate synthase small subunit